MNVHLTHIIGQIYFEESLVGGDTMEKEVEENLIPKVASNTRSLRKGGGNHLTL